MIRIKSIYAEAEPGDGTRVLVMRRWPRGIRKNQVDEWIKDLSPSDGLLAAYRARKISSREFFERFRTEMDVRVELLERLADRSEQETLTLLCWERRDEDCHRHVLKELIDGVRSGRSSRSRPGKRRNP